MAVGKLRRKDFDMDGIVASAASECMPVPLPLSLSLPLSVSATFDGASIRPVNDDDGGAEGECGGDDADDALAALMLVR